MTHSSQIRTAIAHVINRTLTDTGRARRSFADADTLTGTIGLDSLDLAVVVVGLEQELGVDPFRDAAATARTFGEFAQLYERAVAARNGERAP